MSNNSFIDGLKPRSSRGEERDFLRRKNLSNTTEIFPNQTARPRNIRVTEPPKVNHIPVEFKKIEEPPKKNIKHSYEHDVLGLDEPEDTKDDFFSDSSYAHDIFGVDDEIDLDTEDLKREKRLKKLNRKSAKLERKENQRKNKKIFIFRHKILSFIIILVLILGAVTYFWGDSIVSRITNGRSGLFDLIYTVINGSTKLKTGADGRTNILIFGTSGYDMAGSEGDGAHDGAQLTDSIMVLSVSQTSKDIAMISLPRDLKTDSCLGAGKLNEVYQCGNMDGTHEIDGANALRKRVSDILGIDIQYYAHINWMSLIQVVDTIGGITVVTDEDINDDWTNTYIKAGKSTYLNGESALGLARARHGTVNGDFSRSASQQKIMIAIKDKITSSKLGVMDIINLANILGDNLRSDFDTDAIYAGAKMFEVSNFESIRQIPLNGDGNFYFDTGYINGISYVYPADGVENYDSIRKFVKESLQKNPVVNESANLLVLNGSGESGIADKERDILKEANFNVKGIGNAPSGNYFERVYLYPITNKPATKERLEKYYNTKALDSDLMPTGIDTDGVDFVVILGVGYSAD